jgi:hypothetical protein
MLQTAFIESAAEPIAGGAVFASGKDLDANTDRDFLWVFKGAQAPACNPPDVMGGTRVRFVYLPDSPAELG